MSALDILLALAPEHGPARARLTPLLALCAAQLSPAVFGTFYDQAVALLTLHQLALSERGKDGPAGPLTAEAEGQLSRSYAAPKNILSDLDTTTWGMQFQRLRRSRIMGPHMRTGP